jgi:hypothetical protein
LPEADEDEEDFVFDFDFDFFFLGSSYSHAGMKESIWVVSVLLHALRVCSGSMACNGDRDE